MGLPVLRDEIVAYAALQGLDIAGWHQDVESGAKERRDGLDAVRAAVRTGSVSTLLVYRLDRIARDVLLSETIHRELAATGCRVVSVSEAIDDSPAGNLMRVILSGFAQYERAVIALRTSSGRRARVATTGSYHGGGVPFGYRSVGHRGDSGHGLLAVDDHQAEAVRLVFRLDGERMTQEAIAEELNRHGYRTAKGRSFGKAQVCRILKRAAVYRAEAVTTRTIALASGVRVQHRAIITGE